MKLLALALLFSLTAKAETPAKAPIEYAWNEGDGGDGPGPAVFAHLLPGGSLTLKLVYGPVPGQKASADSKAVFPQGMNGETKKGRWSRTGKTVTLTVDDVNCKYSFRSKVVAASKDSGPGLQCVGKKTGRPAVCPCPLIRKNLNAEFY